MGSIVNSLVGGVSGNAGGAGVNYQAGQANLINPYGSNQNAITTAQDQQQLVNQGLNQQQAFLQAVQAQNGLQNQSNVYNQLQGVTNGTGPNPAQAQLAQATGANTANQAALMAGQRGAGANVGLIARQAAMQGGANQQNAAGQAATLQAQQSLNALGQMGGLATNQANQQANATGAYTNATQAALGQTLGAIGAQNQAANTSMASQNAANAGIAGQVVGSQAGLVGGIANAGASALGAIAGAQGGKVENLPQMYAQGSTDIVPTTGATTSGPSSILGKTMAGYNDAQVDPDSQSASYQGGYKTGEAMGNALSSIGKSMFSAAPTGGGGGGMGNKMMASGGKVPALVSPGEQYIPPQDIPKVKAGADPLSTGERIPGKPQYPGNDYRNDTVKKTLQSGGLVIPNKVMQSKDPHKAAAKFVAAHLKSQSLNHKKG